jgi:2Fe-2S type ferredoxin
MPVFKITFTKSGKTVECPENRTVLEAGQDAGLDLPFSCQGGTCQTCMVKVTGEVEQEEALALSAMDKEKGYALICVGKPLSDLTVEA